MSITTNKETRFVGCTLSQRSYTVHVCSDNAMLDSGDRIDVQVWNGKTVEHICVCPDFPYKVEIDATDEVKAVAEKYLEAIAWVESIIGEVRNRQADAREANEIKVGSAVEVFKGRKIPKGIYTVAQLGTSDYGPYAHLRDSNGILHRYIARGNMRIASPAIPDYSGIEYAGYAIDALTASHGYHGYKYREVFGILADELQDKEDWRAEHIRNYSLTTR